MLTLATVIALAGCGSNTPHNVPATTGASPAQKAKTAACSTALDQYTRISGDAGGVEQAIRSSGPGAPSNLAPFNTLVADDAALQTTLSELRRTVSPAQQAQLGQYQTALSSLQQSAREFAVGNYAAGNADIVGVVAQIGSLGQLITSMCGP